MQSVLMILCFIETIYLALRWSVVGGFMGCTKRGKRWNGFLGVVAGGINALDFERLKIGFVMDQFNIYPPEGVLGAVYRCMVRQ